MAVIQRWEIVEYSLDTPASHHDITQLIDRLRAELGDRWESLNTVKVLAGDDGEIVFRYRKALT